ncbi:MAG: methyltransferase domain-containing protein, partial [Spirochaetaceae bacterium]|nr:methyltransferase domain-containing protein [Spirochaetaceae bacterium]
MSPQKGLSIPQGLTKMIPPSLVNRVHTSWDSVESFDIILLDQRCTSIELFKDCLGYNVPIIALDEGGDRRDDMDFLLDSLPGKKLRSKANIEDRNFLFFKEPPMSLPWENRENFLISFGNEDPRGLTQKVLKVLTKKLLVPAGQITVVKGPLYTPLDVPEGVKILDAPDNLSEIMPQYKWIFCSLGITVFEAYRAGSIPLLVNPSKYHQNMSKQLEFPLLGTGGISLRGMAILKNLSSLEIPLKYSDQGLSLQQNESPLAHLLGSLKMNTLLCPCCKKSRGRVLERFPRGTYRKCPDCKNTYYQDGGTREKLYESSYFFEDYKKQYGKTYLQDFDHIKSMGQKRLSIIRSLLKKGDMTLCDLGCAFGPFLLAAKESGFQPMGVDISADAVKWVNQQLNIPAVLSSLTDDKLYEQLKSKPVDVITLWYVIEHLRDQDDLLHRIYNWLKPGGVLAFSTPHGKGISQQKNRRKFLHSSPRDHFIIYSL